MAGKFYAIVAGVGSGTGASVARKFATKYSIVLLARKASNYEPLVKEINASGGHAIGISTDLADSKSVASAFETIKKEFSDAKLAAAVFNAGGGFVRKSFLELTEAEFVSGYQSQGLGLYNLAHHAVPLLLAAVSTSPHPPTLLLTGATASIRGSANTASFATGKFAERALGQSLAREFHPKGVHVAHAIIDGGIDTPWGKDRVVNGGVEDGKIDPDAIADAYWHLHTQPRSAFTQEIDLRPYVEKF